MRTRPGEIPPAVWLNLWGHLYPVTAHWPGLPSACKHVTDTLRTLRFARQGGCLGPYSQDAPRPTALLPWRRFGTAGTIR